MKNALVLKIPYLDKEFMVFTYSYKRGIGRVLMQEGQVVWYEYTKLNEHEHNHVIHDIDLVAIMHTFKMWRHYLHGKRFIFMSDESGLRYLFDQPNLKARKVRWLATLSELEFEIRYINGKENKVAYPLRRGVQMNHVAVVSSYGIDLQDQIL